MVNSPSLFFISLKVLSKSCILASLVGGYCTESRVKVAKEMALQPVDGFLIEGLDVSLDRGESANMDAIIPLINETMVRIHIRLGLHSVLCLLVHVFRKFYPRNKCVYFQGAGAQRRCGLWCRVELTCLTPPFQQSLQKEAQP